jgi:hypothetical protein
MFFRPFPIENTREPAGIDRKKTPFLAGSGWIRRTESSTWVVILHVFDFDIRDVAETLQQHSEVYWTDTRINKVLLITLLPSAEENSYENDDNTSKATSIKSKGNERTIEDDMAAVSALESFNLALVDLKRYFYYEEDFVYVL